MQDKHQERAKAWRKIRKTYEEKRALLWGEDHEQKYKDYKQAKDDYLNIRGNTPPYVSPDTAFEALRKEFEIIKTAQFRKQFKEDYPKFEAQIEGNEQLEKMAREDIKRIIAPFYLAEFKNVGFLYYNDLTTFEDLDRLTSQITIGILCTGVITYDLYKTCIAQTSPSLIINFAAGALIAYNKPAPKAVPKNNWVPGLIDYVTSATYKETKPYPNYKSRLENETNQERSC